MSERMSVALGSWPADTVDKALLFKLGVPTSTTSFHFGEGTSYEKARGIER